jgi:serine/threonine protein phosphatase PrpC
MSTSKASAHSGLFGVKLNDVMARPTQKSIPTVLRDLFVHLQRTGLHQDGLFRVSVPPDQLLASKSSIDIDGSAESTISTMDPHLTASLIKLYFRELPESLFTHDLHNVLIANFENVSELRQIVQNQLPVHHKKVAEVLFLLLGMVLDNIHMNKMSPNELAVIFGSLLIRPAHETLESIADIPKRAQFILTLIYNADKIFPTTLVTRSIIKKFDAPEITAQRETVEKYKGSLNEHIQTLAVRLGTLKKDLDAATSMEDIVSLTKALKTLHNAFDHYSTSKPSTSSSSASADGSYTPRHIPSYVCKTLLESGHTSLQGPRPTMEDRVIMMDDLNEQYQILSAQTNRAFYAVFDGHAGDRAAEYASQIVAHCIVTEATFTSPDKATQALKDGLIKADAKIVDKANEEGWPDGSTAVLVCIIGEKLYSANLGDSEAIVCVNKGNTRVPHCLVHKHKPTDDSERDRIIALGAPVFRGRILGKLAVSRALGDAEYKVPKAKANFVSNDAYAACLDLNESHEFIILACDGLWDKLTHQEAIDYVHEHLALGQDAHQISALLAQHALDKGSRDNVTVIIVLLKWRPVQQK